MSESLFLVSSFCLSSRANVVGAVSNGTACPTPKQLQAKESVNCKQAAVDIGGAVATIFGESGKGHWREGGQKGQAKYDFVWISQSSPTNSCPCQIDLR